MIKKFISNTRILFVLTIFIASSALIFGFTVESDFSGEWTFNEEESDLGQSQFNFVWEDLNITQTSEEITIERHGEGQNGPVEITDTIKLNGEESENLGFGQSVRTSTARWVEGSDDLLVETTIEFEANGQTNEIETSETYTLDESGQTLTITNEVTSNFGDISQTLVYEKN